MYDSLVSVIIPSYNHEKFVQKSIESIIQQTYKNIELILIDDGSTDSTWQKIQELKEECETRFTNVVTKTRENKGTCETLNELISLSSGEFVYLIASDDISKPQAIEKEVKFLQDNSEYGLCVGDNEIIDSEGTVCFWDKKQNLVYKKKDAKYLTFVDFLESNKKFKFTSEFFGTYEELYKGNHVPNGYLIRKSVLDFIEPFTKEAPLEDWFMMLQISKYFKMKYFDEVLFSYRWHENNTVKDINKIREYSILTRLHEEKISEEIIVSEEKLKPVLPNALPTMKHGSLYKKQGIPFLFEILSYFKRGHKYKKIKLFNITIASFVKKEEVDQTRFF